MAVTGGNGNTISIMLGNGDGTFGSPTIYTVTTEPLGILAGDFNGDGKVDLAVVNYVGDTLSILLGNGDGTFQAAVNYATGDQPTYIAAGDFNGDHKLDLVVGEFDSGGSYFQGNGDGTFQARVALNIPGDPTGVQAADLNHDGKLDIIASAAVGGVAVLLGNGDGTFQAQRIYPNQRGDYLVVADFNRDGNPDVAASDYTDGEVNVLYGAGDGTLSAPVAFSVGAHTETVAVGDFNKDGLLDLVSTNDGPGTVSVLLGASSRNVISGNAGDGVLITGSGTTGNVVEGNYIGVDVTGSTTLANHGNGVSISGTGGNTVGGTASGAGNVISGNTGDGVNISSTANLVTPVSLYNADGNANDSVSGNNGTLEGGVTYAPGIAGGQAFDFNGSTGSVVIPDAPSLDVTTQFTLAAWINPSALMSDAAGQGGIISKVGFSTGEQGYQFFLTGNNTVLAIQFVSRKPGETPGNTANAFRLTLANAIPMGQWTYVAATYDHDSLRLYVNGTLVGTEYVGPKTVASSGANLRISGDDNDNVHFAGLIDQAAVYNVALSTSQIQAVYAAAGYAQAGNAVQGNYIGTNAAGTAALGNYNGVAVYSAGNTIGGTTAGAGNVISGSYGIDGVDGNDAGVGVLIEGSAASGNLVEGNFIGTDKTGTIALANVIDGVSIFGASGNTIGGTTAAARNVISGNGTYLPTSSGLEAGVDLNNGSTDNLVEGNFIGTDVTGTLALSNGDNGASSGVAIIGNSDDNTIGGASSLSGGQLAGAGNLIDGLNADGTVGVYVQASSGNVIAGNFIGVDVTGTQVVGNYTGVRLSEASNNTVGGTTAGLGNLISGNTTGVIIGDASATNNLVEGNLIGTDVTGTHRLAIGGPFGAVSGITVNTPPQRHRRARMPRRGVVIAAAEFGISLYAATVVQGNWIETNAASDATLGNTVGIEVVGAGSTIGGTIAGARNIISGNSGDGIDITGSGATGNVVEGNYIGTDATGEGALGNANVGVFVSAATGAVIGGTTAGARNVISGTYHSDGGDYIGGSGVSVVNHADGTVIEGNYIGTDKDGVNALGNLTGVSIYDSTNVTVGGTAAGAGNVISGNGPQPFGIGVVLVAASNNFVQGNFIGTTADGHAALSNATYGIQITNGSNNNTIGGSSSWVGGVLSGAGNLISGNLAVGIEVDPGASDEVIAV